MTALRLLLVMLGVFAGAASNLAADPVPLELKVEWSDPSPAFEVRQLIRLDLASTPIALGAVSSPRPTVLSAARLNNDIEIFESPLESPQPRKVGAIPGPFGTAISFINPGARTTDHLLLFTGNSAYRIRTEADGQRILADEINLGAHQLSALILPSAPSTDANYFGWSGQQQVLIFRLEESRLVTESKLEDSPTDLLPVTADLDGDGHLDFVRHGKNFIQLAGLSTAPHKLPDYFSATDTPDGQYIRRVLAGEFDGLPGNDLLVETTPLRVLWLCSGGDLPRCTPQQILPFPTDVATVADLDSDGVDELIWNDRNQIYSASLRSGHSVTQGEIAAEDGRVIATLSSEGSTVLVRSIYRGPIVITAVDAGRSHVQRRIRFAPGPRMRITIPREGLYSSRTTADRPSCIGYNVRSPTGIWGRLYGRCPENHAVVEVDDAHLRSVSCCPLPRRLQLNDDEEVTDFICPPGKIVTGLRAGLDRHPTKLFCRSIRTPGVTVGKREGGVYWGGGLSMRGEPSAITRSQISPAIRHGAGRVSRDRWDDDGCIARQQGTNRMDTVLVGRIPGECALAFFAPLLQHDGKDPIELFAPCTDLPDPLNPLAGCTSDHRHAQPH